MNIDIQKVAEVMCEVADNEVLPLWRNLEPDQIKQKTSAFDIVTEADLRAERMLSEHLLDMLPDSLILGEEGYASDPDLADALATDKWVWIVDPVDGTSNFAKGLPDFGMIISLVNHNKTYAGRIYHPVTGHMLMTESGSGTTYCNQKVSMLPSKPLPQMHGILGMDILPQRAKFQSLDGAPDFDPENYVCCASAIALLTSESFFNSSTRKQKHFRAVMHHCLPWDDAAGVLAIREAGGEVMNWQGELHRPDMFHKGILAAPTLEDCKSLREWLLNAYKVLP